MVKAWPKPTWESPSATPTAIHLPDVVISHFLRRAHDALVRAPARAGSGGSSMKTRRSEAGLAVDSRALTGWGMVLADLDLDGHLDLLQTNGHIRREPSQLYPYENPPILWRNLGNGRFANVICRSRPVLQESPYGPRIWPAADLDADGDVDFVVVHHHKPSVVLWNESPRQRKLSDCQDCKAPAPIAMRSALGYSRKSARTNCCAAIDGGGSYLSSSDPRVHFGLGDATRIDRLEIRWPSGKARSEDKPAGESKYRVGGRRSVASAD